MARQGGACGKGCVESRGVALGQNLDSIQKKTKSWELL
jgi:hypothetical protein